MAVRAWQIARRLLDDGKQQRQRRLHEFAVSPRRRFQAVLSAMEEVVTHTDRRIDRLRDLGGAVQRLGLPPVREGLHLG